MRPRSKHQMMKPCPESVNELIPYLHVLVHVWLLLLQGVHVQQNFPEFASRSQWHSLPHPVRHSLPNTGYVRDIYYAKYYGKGGMASWGKKGVREKNQNGERK